MRNLALTWCCGFLVLALGAMCGEVSGLTIYRFGGASLPPPPEAGRRGVEFVQLDWRDVDIASAGEVFQVEVNGESLHPLRYNPSKSIAPQETRPGASWEAESERWEAMFDQDLETRWLSRYLCADERRSQRYCDGMYGNPGTIDIALPGPTLVDRVRITSGFVDPARVVRHFRLHLSGGDLTTGQSNSAPRRPAVVEVQGNEERFLDVEIPEHQRVRSLQVALAEHNEVWEISEIEVYARGIVDQAFYVSRIIDVGHPAVWGDLSWSMRQDPGAEVFMRTRSGEGGDPNLYWQYTGIGDQKVQVSRTEYNRLFATQRAGITFNKDKWTFWPPPYDLADTSGTPFIFMSPRPAFQFKVDFTSRGEAGSELEFLEIRASAPVATELVGEIFPVQVKVGEESRFTYVMKPGMEPDDIGFDRLEMRPSAAVITVLHAVRIGGVEAPFAVAAMDESGFEVDLPRLGPKDSDTLIELVFSARVLRYGARFTARISDRSQPLEFPQSVPAGDASDEFEWNTVSVRTSVDPEALLEVEVAPGVFTPNGDGVNDVATVAYGIFETTGPVAVEVEIRDLSGGLVCRVYSGEDLIGFHQRVWDGRDGSGAPVPPGVYVYRVFVNTAKGQVDKIGTLHLVY